MKVLFPVSPEDPSGAALLLAIDTARSHGGEIHGLALVDLEGIRRVESGAPPGAIYLARQAEKRLAERDAAMASAALEKVAAACRAAGVAFHGEVAAGDPRREMEKACASCDLLVSGIASQFAHDQSDAPGEMVLSLMRSRSAPLLLSASIYRPVSTVVVGCGGGDRTSRAVSAMTRLSLWRSGCRILLLAIADSPDEGEARLAPVRHILSDAGYRAPEERVLSGTKSDRFPAFCEEAGADAAVLGGWGEHRWDDFLSLSVTGRMLSLGLQHLFLYM
jgi:nucleotide-binding universal stress UspA family protein